MKKNSNKTHLINESMTERRRREIQKLLSSGYLASPNKMLVDFIFMYIDCEALARKYIQYLESDLKKNNSSGFESLQYKNIHKSTDHFGLNIKEELTKSVFEGSAGVRGSKTPRQLRNGFIHGKSLNDIKEIEQRHKELMQFMKEWYRKASKLS